MTQAADKPADQFDKLPPHSIEAEQCLLASLMLDRELLAQVRDMIQPGAFYLADHLDIYRVILALRDASRPVDAVTVREELLKRGQLEEIGGTAYLAEVLNTVPSAANGLQYAQIVRDKWLMRSVIGVSSDAIRAAYSPTFNVRDAAMPIIANLANAAAELLQRGATESISEAGPLAMDSYERISTGAGSNLVPTGFRDLDELIGGIGEGEAFIVGARTSVGKSTFNRQLALNAASAGVPVLLVSLEESKAKIVQNWQSNLASIDNYRLRGGGLNADELQRLARSVNELTNLPLFICDDARTPDAIRARVAAARAKHGVRLVIIDHLSRVRVPGSSEYERVTRASGALVDLIKDAHVAGVIAAQLSRESARREDHRPTMTDLRDSGAIEQDADGIILLHREDYYGTRTPGYEPTGEAELIIEKMRDGRRGYTVVLDAKLKYQRFSDWPADRYAKALGMSPREAAAQRRFYGTASAPDPVPAGI